MAAVTAATISTTAAVMKVAMTTAAAVTAMATLTAAVAVMVTPTAAVAAMATATEAVVMMLKAMVVRCVIFLVSHTYIVKSRFKMKKIARYST
jgi:hypothetical protein